MQIADSRMKALAFTLTFLAGCGPAARTSALSMAEAESSTAPGPPATVAEAVRIVDLASLPLSPGATFSGRRRLASLFYEAPATVQAAFDFHAKQLNERGFRQAQGSQVTEQYASATFLKDGYKVSAMVFPAGKAGKVNVTLTCLGNVDVSSLPVAADAKPFFSGPASAMFLSEAPAKKVAEGCRALLIEKGWEPYGVAGDSQFFKQNAIRLTAFIAAAPAQGEKTMITYSGELMSVELPAPQFAQHVQYADSTTALSFQTAKKPVEVFDFYRQSLAKAKWEPTTKNAIDDRGRKFQIFRNPAKDMLTLETSSIPDTEKSQVSLKHQSAAEIAELDRLIKEEQERKAAMKKGAPNKPLPRLGVPIPTRRDGP